MTILRKKQIALRDWIPFYRDMYRNVTPWEKTQNRIIEHTFGRKIICIWSVRTILFSTTEAKNTVIGWTRCWWWHYQPHGSSKNSNRTKATSGSTKVTGKVACNLQFVGIGWTREQEKFLMSVWEERRSRCERNRKQRNNRHGKIIHRIFCGHSYPEWKERPKETEPAVDGDLKSKNRPCFWCGMKRKSSRDIFDGKPQQKTTILSIELEVMHQCKRIRNMTNYNSLLMD